MKQHPPSITAAAALIRARLNAIGIHTSTEFGGVIAEILTATLGAPPTPEAPAQEETPHATQTAPAAPPAPARKKPKTMAPPKADRVPFGILTTKKAG